MWRLWKKTRFQKTKNNISLITTELSHLDKFEKSEETMRDKAEFRFLSTEFGIYDYETAFKLLSNLCLKHKYDLLALDKSNKSTLQLSAWSHEVLQKRKLNNWNL